MDWIDIFIKATGDLGAWMWSYVQIVVRATPGFGIPPIVFLGGGLLVLFGGWQIMNDKT